jgi:uncharacterized membrane protein
MTRAPLALRIEQAQDDCGCPKGGRMHVIVTVIIFVGLAALLIWVADWTTVSARRPTAIDVLNRRLARGEIDRAEYEEKRKLIGR